MEEKQVKESELYPADFDDPDDEDYNVDSATKYAESIRKVLTIGGSHQILLGIAWTCDDASRQFQMFPEVVASDVTFKTNKEKRPHGALCGLFEW